MADFTHSPMAGNFHDVSTSGFGPSTDPKRLTQLTNVAGAALSLALVVGIGIWGYKLLVRDVTGIPVVRAIEGEMRVRPAEPGGETASHQGLSVNAVAAVGTAAKPADRLILAPKPIDLTEEDQVITAAMVAPAPQERTPAALPQASVINAEEVSAALESGNVEDLLAQLTAGVAPLVDLSEATDDVAASVAAAVVAEFTAVEKEVIALATAPGVRASVRPKKRPATRAVVVPTALETPQAQASETAAISPDGSAASDEVDAASLPAGTRLAQLGAFDSPEVAREQWDQLQGRFAPYLEGKSRIVQRAKSGGRVFYRLRAMGFEDIADARRFCSALVAQNADCIPVVTR